MVLNINTYYFTSSLYSELEDELIRLNTDLTTYVPVTNNYFCRKECEGNIKTNVIISKCLGKYDRMFFLHKHNKIIRDINRKVNFDDVKIIHAHSLFSNGFIALNLYKKYKIPYIVLVQNTDLNVFFSRMLHLRKIGLEILSNASKIIFYSDAYKEKLTSTYVPSKMRRNILDKCISIPSGINEYWIKNKVTSRISPKDRINILYVGSVNKNKNIITVINACKKMIDSGKKVKYTIVGNIDDEKLEKIIKNEDFIKYIPYTNRKDLIDIYRQNDIFVMTSIKESFGLVYLEAMSQGMPVIYTKGQGFDKQFEDGVVGYSVTHDNINEIVDSIEKIALNYNNFSLNCIKNIEKFRWSNIAVEYSNIYRDIYS